MKEEKLDEMNTWYCKKCKDSKEANIRMSPFKLPPILIIHLKRFKTQKERFRRYREEFTKNGIFIDFPLDGLDLTKYLPSEAKSKKGIYDLFGVVNHFGNTGGGHYIAYAKHPKRKEWCTYDDSRFSVEDPERICSDSAYVLFYRQRGF